MKKKIIVLLITAISLSLIGLIYIQVYWIKNAISVKEVQFNRGVSEAASNAIYKYNKIELANKLFNHRIKNNDYSEFYSFLDSLNRAYYRQISTQPSIEVEEEKNISYFVNKNKSSIDINKNKNKKATNNILDSSLINISIPKSISNEKHISENKTIRFQESPPPFTVFREKTKIINDLFDDIIHNSFSFNLPHEVRQPILDSILNLELSNQGIKTEYEIAIYNPILNTISSKYNQEKSRKILENGYIFSLYPNHIFNNPEYLLLYFPGQKRYVLSQLNLMLRISTLFILSIIFSFVFIIFTIIRQKKLSVMKNDFINNMTHELKTPISTISLACQALNDKDVQKTGKLYQSYVTMIDEENDRLESMTEKVLQTALIDKGQLKLKYSNINIHEIIENAIEKISLQLKSRNGIINKKLCAEKKHIEADKIHLTNVIFNLLDNAIKYSVKSPIISIETTNSNYGIYVKVRDNGVGISKAHQKKIFENLYRISKGNIHDVKGFGLGLSYVKKIIEKHKGKINIESELNKGSEFTIYIPFENANN